MAAETPNLSLVTPTQGTLSGTWGNTVNNGITEYTDIAIAGTLTLNGDGAVNLVNTIGSASATNIGYTTAQYAILKVTGTLTTTKVITAPSGASYSKTYVVLNNATGGSVTIKASGQTGVTITVGDKALVAFNGTDYVRVGASAGGSDTQVQYNSGGNLAGSANMTFDGSNLQIGSQGDLRLADSDSSNYVALQSPATVTSNVTFTLPGTDGSTGQAIITNGSGVLSFGNAGVSQAKVTAIAMVFGF
jgi:hypothetical protein